MILTSLTPFGQSGPWADFQANNLLITNLSGFSRDHPGPVDDLERQPPLQLAAHQSDFIAGLTAAAATVTALNRRHQLGGGGHVDVSEMEVLSLLPQTGLTEYSRGNPPKGRHKSVAGIESLRAILPCRDGYISISPRQQDQWGEVCGDDGKSRSGPRTVDLRLGPAGWRTGPSWNPCLPNGLRGRQKKTSTGRLNPSTFRPSP